MHEPATRPPRYSGLPLPARRYRPGRGPHPARRAGGPVYATPEDAPAIDPERWSSCEPYLHAIDLFNHGYFWEAHEALEGLWRRAGRASAMGIFLQALILVSAALLKHSMGEISGARRLASRGCATLRATPGVRLGIEVSRLAEQVAATIDGRTPCAPAIELVGVELRQT